MQQLKKGIWLPPRGRGNPRITTFDMDNIPRTLGVKESNERGVCGFEGFNLNIAYNNSATGGEGRINLFATAIARNVMYDFCLLFDYEKDLDLHDLQYFLVLSGVKNLDEPDVQNILTMHGVEDIFN